MAGSQINSYGIGDVNLTSLMASVDAERIGFCAVSLTNYDNTSEPEIAEGSKIEVNGALFKFDADEAIGGSPSDGTVYIKLIPVSTSITAEFTNTAPTWDTEKQGWYSPTPGEENYRYLPFGMTKSGSSYSNKHEMYSAIKKNIDCNMVESRIIESYDYNILSPEVTIAALYSYSSVVFDTGKVVTVYPTNVMQYGSGDATISFLVELYTGAGWLIYSSNTYNIGPGSVVVSHYGTPAILGPGRWRIRTTYSGWPGATIQMILRCVGVLNAELDSAQILI